MISVKTNTVNVLKHANALTDAQRAKSAKKLVIQRCSIVRNDPDNNVTQALLKNLVLFNLIRYCTGYGYVQLLNTENGEMKSIETESKEDKSF